MKKEVYSGLLFLARSSQKTMVSNFLVLFSFLFFSALVHGAVSNDCKKTEVGRFTLPVFPDQNQIETFEYRYFLKKTSDNPDTPTIIFVPGGPGGTSINMGFAPTGNSPDQMDFLEIAYGLPKNYNVILTDPRGRGCNFDPEKPLSEKAFRTPYLASDILALIRHLKLKNYILLGHSYGTVLVTQVAARAGQGEAPVPAAVVLSGVVGKYFVRNEQDDAFQNEWSLVYKNLPGPIADLFPQKIIDFKNSVKLPLDISGELWLNFIKEKLTLGTILITGNPLVPKLESYLREVLSQDPNAQDRLVEEILESENQMAGLEDNPLYVQIACREIFSDEDECLKRNIPMDNPYNSDYWQISSPIYYVQGENDPNTPVSHSFHHFAAQKNPKRVLVTVPLAGHMAMSAINECKDLFWKSVYTGDIDLKKSLSSCSAAPAIFRP